MPQRSNDNSRLVYSTEAGPAESGRIKTGTPGPGPGRSRSAAGDGVVRISRQTKGRKGKGVSCIAGLPLTGEALEKLAKQLKQRCGAGGTVKDGVVEIQGDHREVLAQELERLGYVVKLAGG